MIPILSLLFAALADNAEQPMLPISLSSDNPFGAHLVSLLGHADIRIEDQRLVDITGPLPRTTQIDLLRWLHQIRSQWISNHYLDKNPRSMTYAHKGRQLRWIVEWMKETGFNPAHIEEWFSVFRQAMKHHMFKPQRVTANMLLGNMKPGRVVYRFLADPPKQSWMTDRSTLHFKAVHLPVRDLEHDPDSSQWTVQWLMTPEHIQQEIIATGNENFWELPSHDDRWLSLRDRDGTPLMTFVIQKSADPERSTLIAVPRNGLSLLDLDPDSWRAVLEHSAEIALHFRKPEDWSPKTLVLLWYADDQESLIAFTDAHRDRIFRRDNWSFSHFTRQLVEFFSEEHCVPQGIAEIWYRATIETPISPSTKKHSSTSTMMLPWEIAQMQLERIKIDRSHPATRALQELVYDLDEDSDGSKMGVHEARFAIRSGRTLRVLQIMLWWEGRDADGQWVERVRMEPLDMVNEGILDEAVFYDQGPRDFLFSTVTHDLRTALLEIQLGYDRVIRDLDPDEVVPMVIDEGTDYDWIVPVG